MIKENIKLVEKEVKPEVKPEVKKNAFTAFWANYKAQYPEKALAKEESGEVEQIEKDFKKSLINLT